MNTLITLIEIVAAVLALATLGAVFIRKSPPATYLTLVWWLLVCCGTERCLAWLNFAFSAVKTAMTPFGSWWGQTQLMVSTLTTVIAGLLLFYLASRIAAVRARYTATSPLRAWSELRSAAASAETKAAVAEGLRAAEAKSRDTAASLVAHARAMNDAGKTAWAESANTAGAQRAKNAATGFWRRLSRQQQMLLAGLVALSVIGIGVVTETGNGKVAATGGGARYVAAISCTVGSSSAPIYACMDDRGGIELRNGGHYKVYMQHEVMNMGRWNGQAIEIDLADRFEIEAQNRSDSTLVLNVVIRNTQSGAVVFQKSATSYGTIRVKQ